MGLVRVHSRALPGTRIHPDPGRGRLGWRRRSRRVNRVSVVGLRVWRRYRVVVLSRGWRLTIVRNGGCFNQHVIEAR